MIRTEEALVAVVSLETTDAAPALASVIEALQTNARVRAIVLRVSAFAGLDPTALRSMKLAKDAEGAARSIAASLMAIHSSAKPVVAWIEEDAIGASFELALACTGSVASSHARVGLPFVELGLLPPGNGLLRVAQRAGMRSAIDLGLTGRAIGAADAASTGLVDEVGDLDAARAFAVLLAERPAFRETLPRARARRGRSITQAAVESNPIGRGVLLERAKKDLAKTRGHGAGERILEVLRRFSLFGFSSAAALEARVFGELAVSEASHRLVELSVAVRAIRAVAVDESDGERDIVVEAVPRALADAQNALATIESKVSASCVIALTSPVSPIEGIASAAREPSRVVGMHEERAFVEVVAPGRAAPDAVARVVALARRRDKSAIVVKDTPGFFTQRILGPYLGEAVRLVAEGFSIEGIDGALVDWGFAHGPLATVDQLGIDVVAHIASMLEDAFGARHKAPAAMRVIEKSARRFYVRGRPDEGIYRLVDRADPRRAMPEDLSMRCSLAMINEAMWCLGEGVVACANEGDVGAVLGVGFPAFRGGPFRFVDVIGAADVLRRVRSLEQRYGARFEPAPLLVDMARSGRRLYS